MLYIFFFNCNTWGGPSKREMAFFCNAHKSATGTAFKSDPFVSIHSRQTETETVSIETPSVRIAGWQKSVNDTIIIGR